VTGLLRRASLRFYLRHPWQLGLAIAGISLGVGVYVGVSLANDSAARAFDVTAAEVRGPLTHRLLPLNDALDERLYAELVLRDGTITAAPVVEAEVGIGPRRSMRAARHRPDSRRAAFRCTVAPTSAPAARQWSSHTVLLPEELARELGLTSGDSTTLRIGEREATVNVIGFVARGGADVAAEPPIVADIATAQELTGTLGRIDRIDLALTETQARELGLTPERAVLIAAEARRAFRE
jgi:putative ABC transport system permease protein